MVKNLKDARLKIIAYIITYMDRKANKMNTNFIVQRVVRLIYWNKNSIIVP
jgi:hypothetical protein